MRRKGGDEDGIVFRGQGGMLYMNQRGDSRRSGESHLHVLFAANQPSRAAALPLPRILRHYHSDADAK